MTSSSLYNGMAVGLSSRGSADLVVTKDNPNDELGVTFYGETHLTGTQAGHVYGGGLWINIDSGFVDLAGGYFIAAQDNGIYEAAATTFTNAIYVFGMRMEFISTSTPSGGFHAFSLNTSNRSLTSVFILADGGPSIGFVTGTGANSTKLGSVPLYKTSSGTIGYVRIYDAAS